MHSILEYHQKLYEKGDPILSDAEYDSLEKYIGSCKSIGKATGQTLEHKYRMYSLEKVFTEDFEEYFSNRKLDLYIETPKYDGAAIACYYIDGSLAYVLKRGDGEIGEDCTRQVIYHNLVPFYVNSEIECVQGEVVIPNFHENARNKASGALSRKEDEDIEGIKFFAYNLYPYYYDSFTNDMNFLYTEGFEVVTEEYRDTDYDTDGKVYRVDSYNRFKELGFTDKYPKGAFAVKDKEQFEIKETKLLDVTWDTGKGGKVTPVAVFEPILLEGANCQRATLHNVEFLEELDLHKGDLLLVTRSGGIIPKILGKKNDS